jgi:hypothetical protein
MHRWCLASALLAACAAPIRASLAGNWTGSFVLDRSYLTPIDSGTAIRGTLHLLPRRPEDESLYMQIASVDYVGTYHVDFRPVGGWLTGTADTMIAAPMCSGPDARMYAVGSSDRDSVHIVLNPCVDHGGVVLQGVQQGDSITGEWWEVTIAGSSGRFVLRRP